MVDSQEVYLVVPEATANNRHSLYQGMAKLYPARTYQKSKMIEGALFQSFPKDPDEENLVKEALSASVSNEKTILAIAKTAIMQQSSRSGESIEITTVKALAETCLRLRQENESLKKSAPSLSPPPPASVSPPSSTPPPSQSTTPPAPAKTVPVQPPPPQPSSPESDEEGSEEEEEEPAASSSPASSPPISVSTGGITAEILQKRRTAYLNAYASVISAPGVWGKWKEKIKAAEASDIDEDVKTEFEGVSTTAEISDEDNSPLKLIWQPGDGKDEPIDAFVYVNGSVGQAAAIINDAKTAKGVATKIRGPLLAFLKTMKELAEERAQLLRTSTTKVFLFEVEGSVANLHTEAMPQPTAAVASDTIAKSIARAEISDTNTLVTILYDDLLLEKAIQLDPTLAAGTVTLGSTVLSGYSAAKVRASLGVDPADYATKGTNAVSLGTGLRPALYIPKEDWDIEVAQSAKSTITIASRNRDIYAQSSISSSSSSSRVRGLTVL